MTEKSDASTSLVKVTAFDGRRENYPTWSYSVAVAFSHIVDSSPSSQDDVDRVANKRKETQSQRLINENVTHCTRHDLESLVLYLRWTLFSPLRSVPGLDRVYSDWINEPLARNEQLQLA